MNLLFAGESKHVLDDKKRLSIPARYRQWCAADSECEFVITKVRGNYLIAYPYPEWATRSVKLGKPLSAADFSIKADIGNGA